MTRTIQLPIQTLSSEAECKILAYGVSEEFKRFVGKKLRIKPEMIAYIKLLGLDFEGWGYYVIYIEKKRHKEMKDYRITVRYDTVSGEPQEVIK